MFEKEAEEYVIKKHRIDKTKLPIDFSLRCEFSDDFTDFQKGAEFGFNKANEWHDLRKDPNALPNNYRYVWRNLERNAVEHYERLTFFQKLKWRFNKKKYISWYCESNKQYSFIW